ncbi:MULTISPECIES: hypothetical protein [Kribbella]|uniref:hypothetical protein n=1 Tax=Kribbella TaxID=182639 RepID=UPI001053C1C8|nr:MULTISPECIES: hypothetical protein [Kribbella]
MTPEDKLPPSIPDILTRAAIEAVPIPSASASLMTIYDGFHKRRAHRMGQALAEITERVTVEQLEARLSESESLDAVFGTALAAAASSGLEAKRRMLGAVVAQAVLDDAMIDEAILLTDVLSQIEAPHVRCLEDVHRVQKEVETSGERPPAAAGAEREINQRILDTGRKYPSPLLKTLANLSLLDAETSWDRSVDYVHGLTTFGEEFLQYLHGMGDADRGDPV